MKELMASELNRSKALNLLQEGKKWNNEYVKCLEMKKEDLEDELEDCMHNSMIILIGFFVLLASTLIWDFVSN